MPAVANEPQGLLVAEQILWQACEIATKVQQTTAEAVRCVAQQHASSS